MLLDGIMREEWRNMKTSVGFNFVRQNKQSRPFHAATLKEGEDLSLGLSPRSLRTVTTSIACNNPKL